MKGLYIDEENKQNTYDCAKCATNFRRTQVELIDLSFYARLFCDDCYLFHGDDCVDICTEYRKRETKVRRKLFK